MTTPDAVKSTAFYEKRHLETPDREWWPEERDELCEMIDELSADDTRWQLVGDAQHLRDDGAFSETTVLRTDDLDGLLELDAKSGLVRVEAGMKWKTLQDHLGEEGLSLQRYGLHPASSTVGGLLARRRPSPPLLRGGQVLDGCVSLGAHDPKLGDYRYLVAPRKASGPDLRYEFIGNGDKGGAILDATFVVWRPVAQKLVRYRDCSLTEARTIVDALYRAQSSPSWLHYSSAGATLQFGLTAPGQLLRSRMQWLADEVGEPDEVADGEAASRRRRWLEARHPDRRGHPEAASTLAVWLVPPALDDGLDALFGEHARALEITSWNPRRAKAFVRFDEAKPPALSLPEHSCWAWWPLVS